MRGFMIGLLVLGVLGVVCWFGYSSLHLLEGKELTPAIVMTKCRDAYTDAYYEIKYSHFTRDLQGKMRLLKDMLSPKSHSSTDDLKKVTPDSIPENFK